MRVSSYNGVIYSRENPITERATLMLFHIIRKVVPHRKFSRSVHTKFAFDVMERGYLLHWAMEIPTLLAVGMAFTITLTVLLLFTEEV